MAKVRIVGRRPCLVCGAGGTRLAQLNFPSFSLPVWLCELHAQKTAARQVRSVAKELSKRRIERVRRLAL